MNEFYSYDSFEARTQRLMEEDDEDYYDDQDDGLSATDIDE